jgi:inner membrane transporter RhtA
LAKLEARASRVGRLGAWADPYDRRVEPAASTRAFPSLPVRIVGRTPAPLLVVASAFSFQCGAAIATHLFDDAGPLGAVWLRQLFGALVLLCLNAGALRRLRTRPIKPVLALGVTLAVMNSLFYSSIDRIPLGVAVTAEFVGPLAVAVAGSRRPRDFIWIALAAAGVLLLGSPTVDIDLVGLGMALGAGACWGCYILIGKHLGQSWPIFDGLTLSLALAATIMTPIGILSAGDALLHPDTLGIALGVGVLASCVPYALELAALRRMSTATFGILMSLEPAVAALAGAAILSQALSGPELLAVVLVVIASIGANIRTRDPIPPAA